MIMYVNHKLILLSYYLNNLIITYYCTVADKDTSSINHSENCNNQDNIIDALNDAYIGNF